MDIVYPIKRTKENKELIYSLRSLQYIQHNKVFIIGDLPDFPIVNINYIPSNTLDSRYETTTNHIKVACQCKDISDDFILMNDDFYFIKPTTIEDLNLDRGLLKEVVNFYRKNHNPMARYDKLVEQTYLHHKEIGQNEPRSFELHAPMIINKTKFLSILPLLKSEALHCCKRTIYGNKFLTNTKSIEDVKILFTQAVDFNKYDSMQFISTSRAMFSIVEPYLKQKFPNKSIYEL